MVRGCSSFRCYVNSDYWEVASNICNTWKHSVQERTCIIKMQLWPWLVRPLPWMWRCWCRWRSTWLTFRTGSHFGFQVCIHVWPPHITLCQIFVLAIPECVSYGSWITWWWNSTSQRSTSDGSITNSTLGTYLECIRVDDHLSPWKGPCPQPIANTSDSYSCSSTW